MVLCLSQDGACTDSFENFRKNSLMGDLSNAITLNPPLFSLVNTFKLRIKFFKTFAKLPLSGRKILAGRLASFVKMEICKIPELLKISQLPKSSFLNGCQSVVLAVHLQKNSLKSDH